MLTMRNTITTATALLLVASVASAQEDRRRESIPADQLPPAGMCRVWIDGLTVTRQPAATDCNTARRNAPVNSRIVYGGSSNGRVYLLPRSTDPRYDPRLDPRNRTGDRDGRELSKEERKRMKEWEKNQRKRNKEWEKSQRSNRQRGDHDGDDDDDRNDDRQNRRNRGIDDRSPRDDGRVTQVPRIFRP